MASVAGGGDFLSGFASAGFGAVAGSVIPQGNFGLGLIASTVAGGVGSVLGGGKFENGAMTGAFGYLFNSAMHPQPRKLSDNEFWHDVMGAVDKMAPQDRLDFYEFIANGGQVIQAAGPFPGSTPPSWVTTTPKGIIYWHPDRIVVLDGGRGIMPPEALLAHEVQHGLYIEYGFHPEIVGTDGLVHPGHLPSNPEEIRVVNHESINASFYGFKARNDCEYPCGHEAWQWEITRAR